MVSPDKPRRRVSQAQIKFTTCFCGCGQKVEYRTTPRVYTPECKLRISREKARISMEKQRRKRGIPKVKGEKKSCGRCGEQITLNRNLEAKYCKPCAAALGRERAKVRVCRLSRERGAPKIGEILVCAHCSESFQRTAARERYCAPCKERQRRGDMPHLKAAHQRYMKEVWPDKYWNEPGVRERALASYKISRAKRKKDPAFTINERMSASVRQSLAYGKQGWRWESLVGYTLADLMTHLERQFLPGMNWDNRGEWHIDHIRPLCSFEFQTPEDPQFREAWALTNLRPLWARDNLRKSGRRDLLL